MLEKEAVQLTRDFYANQGTPINDIPDEKVKSMTMYEFSVAKLACDNFINVLAKTFHIDRLLERWKKVDGK
jgi:hypothetical protein